MTIRNIDNHDQTDIHYLDPSYMGPLQDSPEEVKKWLRSVWYFEFGFEFKTFVPPDFEASETCYLWQLQQRYDFSDRGLLEVSLDVNREVCEKTQFFMNDKLEWVSLLALILALFHCVSTVNYFLKLSHQLEKLQKLYDERVESQMNQAEIIKRNAAKVPEQKLLDNYAKIDKFNTDFKLKESGVSVLLPSERYTSVAEMKQDASGLMPRTASAVRPPNSSELFERLSANSDFTDLSISTLSGEEMDEAELHRL